MRFDLRRLFYAVLVFALLCFTAVVVRSELRKVRETRARVDYWAGHITLEEARELVGDVANTWPPQRPK
jgi:hypothetical protein